MTPVDPPIGEDDLQAHVDQVLSPDRRPAVAAYLDERPEVAARVRAYREQRDALAGRLAGKLEQPIPPRLRVASIAAVRRRRLRRRLSAGTPIESDGGGAAMGKRRKYTYTSRCHTCAAERVRTRP